MAPSSNGYEGQTAVDAAILTELRLFRDEVRDDVAEIKSDIRNLMVTRREWELRNTHVNEQFSSLGREINGLRQGHIKDIGDVREEIRVEVAARRHPWPAVAAAFLAAGALAWTILGPLITGS